MIGLKKLSVIAVLLLAPLSTLAQEVPQESVTVEETAAAVSIGDKIEAVSSIEAEPVTVPELVREEPQLAVDRLFEKAKQENVNRANMRRSTLSETECLATAIYHEARGEGERGMVAVAFVINNRVTSQLYPKSYCQVILQKSQFSFTTDRNPDNIREWEIYKKVLAMAVELVENGGFQRKKSPVGNALFFNSFRSSSGWSYANARKFITTIGKLHFFK